MSNWIRPSILISFVSRIPITLLWNTVSRTTVYLSLTRPNNGNYFKSNAIALPHINGKSKVIMLYPVTISGSTNRKNSRQANSKSASFLKLNTCVPTIDAHVFRVKMFRANGSSCPEIWQTFAIWIILSASGVGNLPRSDIHSISKLIMRRGATLANSPSHFKWN